MFDKLKARNRQLIYGLQAAFSLVAFGWLLGQIDLLKVLSVLSAFSADTLITVILISIAALIPRFLLWMILIGCDTERLFLKAGCVDLTINLANQFLPSRVTGTSIGPVVLRQWFSYSWDRATAIVGVYTTLYTVGYGIVALIGLLTLIGRVDLPILTIIALGTACYLALGTIMFGIGVRIERAKWLGVSLGIIAEALPRLDLKNDAVESAVMGFVGDMGGAFSEIISNRKRVALFWMVLAIFLLVPGLRVGVMLADVNSLTEPTVLIPLYLVAAYSVTVLPLTPGGIGVSEVSATLVLVALGIPKEVAIPIVLTDRLLGVYAPAIFGIYPAMRLNLGLLADKG